jgi:hypothetical protein
MFSNIKFFATSLKARHSPISSFFRVAYAVYLSGWAVSGRNGPSYPPRTDRTTGRGPVRPEVSAPRFRRRRARRPHPYSPVIAIICLWWLETGEDDEGEIPKPMAMIDFIPIAKLATFLIDQLLNRMNLGQNRIPFLFGFADFSTGDLAVPIHL